jgi:hypothetical protein
MVAQACAQVQFIRKKFDDTFSPAVDHYSKLARVPAPERHWVPLGDSVVAYVLTKEGSQTLEESEFVGVRALLMACAAMSIGALQIDTLLRGAVELGNALVGMAAGQLYGPVLAEVHVLESRVAKYPRVVAGPSLVRNLQQVAGSGEHEDSPNVLRRAAAARTSLEILNQDDDGQWFVDYLNAPTQREWSRLGVDDFRGQASSAYEAMTTQEASLTITELAEFGAKYAYLRRYFGARGFGSGGGDPTGGKGHD